MDDKLLGILSGEQAKSAMAQTSAAAFGLELLNRAYTKVLVEPDAMEAAAARQVMNPMPTT